MIDDVTPGTIEVKVWHMILFTIAMTGLMLGAMVAVSCVRGQPPPKETRMT